MSTYVKRATKKQTKTNLGQQNTTDEINEAEQHRRNEYEKWLGPKFVEKTRLKDTVTTLREENAKLKKENTDLRMRVSSLEKTAATQLDREKQRGEKDLQIKEVRPNLERFLESLMQHHRFIQEMHAAKDVAVSSREVEVAQSEETLETMKLKNDELKKDLLKAHNYIARTAIWDSDQTILVEAHNPF